MRKCIICLLVGMTFMAMNSLQACADVCLGGGEWMYRLEKTSSEFYKMIEGSRYTNDSMDTIDITSKITHAVTISATANCSLSSGWGPINATLGYTANRSETWTKEEAVTVKVRPGYIGWVEYGVERDIWKGKHFYVTKYGKEINEKPILITSPRHKAVKAITRKVR